MIRRLKGDSSVVGPLQASVKASVDAAPPRARAPAVDVDALIRAHGRDVYRIVARLVGPATPRADIEDLAQQVFLAAYDARHRFRGDAQVTTWLYGIASRTVLRYLRGWRRRQRMLDTLRTMAELTSPMVVSPEQEVGDRELLQRVWGCLLRIKPKKRVVYILHEIEGLPAKQIAAMLEVKEATVWSRLHHARRELDRALQARELER